MFDSQGFCKEKWHVDACPFNGLNGESLQQNEISYDAHGKLQ